MQATLYSALPIRRFANAVARLIARVVLPTPPLVDAKLITGVRFDIPYIHNTEIPVIR
jgi:hypothetical protein